jgi:hypothetical protein
MRVLTIVSDWHGCFEYRCKIPFEGLLQYKVEVVYCHFTPLEIGKDQLETLINAFSHFDLIIVQRCYLLSVMERIRQACTILGKPLVFETDDDYLSIIPSNPAYFSIAADQELFSEYNALQVKAQRLWQNGDKAGANDLIAKANEDYLPKLMESRNQGLADYLEILKMVDGVTTSTQELANTIYPYNKRIGVFQNNVRQPNPFRLHFPEQYFISEDKEGNKTIDLDKAARFGVHTKPSHSIFEDPKTKAKRAMITPRVGYTCTASHWGEDWSTINQGINQVAKKYENGLAGVQPWWIYFEDKYQTPVFSMSQQHGRGRITHIPPSGYYVYNANISNIDIGICPVFPNSFNLSKSDIKAVEYASWGAAPLVPAFKTYTRNFIDGKTCLTYKNEREFVEKLCLLIENPRLRNEIGKNALDYVCEHRLAHLEENAKPRLDWYKGLIEDSAPLKIFKIDPVAISV